MIPAQKAKKTKDKIQRRRQQNGARWEAELAERIQQIPGAWAYRWPANYRGQPFDVMAVIDGVPVAIECKHVQRCNLAYTSLRANEIEHLERHEQAGGISLIAVRRAEPPGEFYIPWWAVRDDVHSGDRGSIKLTSRLPGTLAEAVRKVKP